MPLFLTLLSVFLMLFGIFAGRATYTNVSQAETSCLLGSTSSRVIISQPGNYTLCTGNNYSPGIDINSNDVTLDGTSGPLIDGGGKPNTSGIFISGRQNVTIKNIAIKGFYNGLEAGNSTNITIDGGDYSSNSIGSSASSGWLSSQSMIDNVGSGIYLHSVTNSTVKYANAHNNVTGITLKDSQNIQVLGDKSQSEKGDFSNNSGWGVKFTSTTGSAVRGIRADNNVRTCGETVGCESAGILLVGHSDNNTIDNNSFNNGGDGLYINGCGQTPSNNNTITNNTADNSPNNGFEATFSTNNTFQNNTTTGSNYGFWLGYSDNSKIINNTVGANTGAINIANSRCNTVANNNITAGANQGEHHIWYDTPGENPCEINSGINECHDNLLSGNTQALGQQGCNNTVNTSLPSNCQGGGTTYPTNTPGPTTTPPASTPTREPTTNNPPASPTGSQPTTNPTGATLTVRVVLVKNGKEELWNKGKAQVYIAGPTERGEQFSVVMDVPGGNQTTCKDQEGHDFACSKGTINWAGAPRNSNGSYPGTASGSYSVQIVSLPKGFAPKRYPNPGVTVGGNTTTTLEIVEKEGQWKPPGTTRAPTPTQTQSYTNKDYENIIKEYEKETITALEVSRWVSQASRVPNLQIMYCYPPGCDFGE